MVYSEKNTPAFRSENKTIKLGATSVYFKRPELKTFTGNCIIDIDNLKEHVVDITLHSALCEKAQILARKGDPYLLKELE